MKARSLMAFWANIAPDNQPAFLRWHNAEHIPERLSIPGFLHGRRYRSATDPARFLMYYETAGPEVLTSPAYLAALNKPTDRTRQALPWFEKPMRNAYDCVGDWGARPARVAPIVVTCVIPAGVTVPVPSGPAGDAKATQAPAVPAALASFGVCRARLYRLEPAGSGVRTSEASIHGATSAASGGLLHIESDDLRLLDQPDAWAALDQVLAGWLKDLGVASADALQTHVIDFDLDNP